MLPKELRQKSSALRNARNALLFAGGLFFATAGMFGYNTGRRAVTGPAPADGDTLWQVIIGLALMLVAIVNWRRSRRRGARAGGDSAAR